MTHIEVTVLTELEHTKKLLTIAVEALRKINNEELNAQRPGGYCSKSAMLSHVALELINSSNKTYFKLW